jgi:hypothetical protein
MNIVQYCCLSAIRNKQKAITMDLLSHGIQRELSKEGKTL